MPILVVRDFVLPIHQNDAPKLASPNPAEIIVQYHVEAILTLHTTPLHPERRVMSRLAIVRDEVQLSDLST